MSTPLPGRKPSDTPSSTLDGSYSDDKSSIEVPTPPNGQLAPLPLATKEETSSGSALAVWLLQTLRIRPKGREHLNELDAVATQPSVFDTDQAEEYQKLLISPEWENFEAFDPSFRWTWREERQTRRIIDWKIMGWVAVMFFALNVDRGNLGNAVSDNMLDDLKLTQADYNLGNTLAKLGFLLAELPSQLISKRLGPDRWIPIQICCFSFISAMQFFLTGRGSFLATRFLIAVFQGGFIPDIVLYLSYWYPSRQLPLRLAFFWVAADFTGIFRGFAAVGLLKMRGIAGAAGWQWLLLIEGLLTLLIGIASFFLMPTAPAKTKAWHRPKGYFTDKQVKIIVNSVIRDDPGKAGMHNRQALTVKMILKGLADYDMYPLYLIGLLFGIPGYPVASYLTLSFRGLGFSVIDTNLLTLPSTAWSIINLLGITIVSELVDNRSFVSAAQNIWWLPNFIALVAVNNPSSWQYFAISTVLLAYPYVHAIHVAWTSRNSGSVQTRTVASAAYNMMVQASAMIGANIYVAEDAPRYFSANKGLIGLIVFNIVALYPGTYFYYRWRNASKAKIWDTYTEQQRTVYLQTTTDVGNKRLDFRFAL
ncbi:major facilitator superfamily domain-containing protein [Dioszegia hungarica]|uniref:Major facilitator superfamily domain-containing protein n=1 Tax=Dioszegia hungarica TaxID=4972 RepID=A0AA38LW48_9TREE|nr:major facilitator superfamily domain-containing protein [Dioszegia hungarica]KAI9637153.1 major facilitator superfamily domain-containing protein [Dioszegia hungarica]